MVALIVLVMLVVLAVVTPMFGADSRDGLDWSAGPAWARSGRLPGMDRSEGRPALRSRLTALGRRVGAAWLRYERAHEVFSRAQQPWLDEPRTAERESLRWRRGMFGRWRLTGRVLPPAGGQLRR
ncbi:MAG TPA: hypothetical protein VFE65_03725 [Pseudonocardia sp.]|jgi:hypothetical protein|nr:hypothetical protein [Pseudonocardia sp.]